MEACLHNKDANSGRKEGSNNFSETLAANYAEVKGQECVLPWATGAERSGLCKFCLYMFR